MKSYYDKNINEEVYCAGDIISVVDVKPLDDYKLLVYFSNGDKKIFDVSYLIDDGVFKPLRNKSIFCRAVVNYGTVVWPGEIDIAPETLYADGILVD